MILTFIACEPARSWTRLFSLYMIRQFEMDDFEQSKWTLLLSPGSVVPKEIYKIFTQYWLQPRSFQFSIWWNVLFYDKGSSICDILFDSWLSSFTRTFRGLSLKVRAKIKPYPKNNSNSILYLIKSRIINKS